MLFSETPVSICIASYNGSNYIGSQIDSILSQARHFDELVIVDDASLDNTVDIIRNFHDNRIHLFRNDINLGHSKSFEAAINHSSHTVILLSDQDDIWPPNRLHTLFHQFLSSNSSILFSYFVDFKSSLDDYRVIALLPDFYSSNIFMSWFHFFNAFSGNYKLYGCTSIFHRRLLDLVLPIPDCIQQHDYWFALLTLLSCNCSLSSYPSLYHRIHDRNVSTRSRRPLAVIFKSRTLLIFCIFLRLFDYFILSRFFNRIR